MSVLQPVTNYIAAKPARLYGSSASNQQYSTSPDKPLTVPVAQCNALNKNNRSVNKRAKQIRSIFITRPSATCAYLRGPES